MITTRALQYVRRRARAYKLGVRMPLRGARYRVPTSISVEAQRVELLLPDDRGTHSAFADLLLSDCYGLDLVHEPVRTVLDVGANVGLFALAARRAFPRATIHCYEPNAALAPYLDHQCRVAGAQWFHGALEAHTCMVSLEIGDLSVTTRSHPTCDGDVPGIAIADAIQRLGGEVDLAKVDCEGAEWRLWEDHEPWKRVRRLTAEYHLEGDRSHDAAVATVRRLGFRVLRHERSAPTYGLVIGVR